MEDKNKVYETYYNSIERQGYSRRDFLKFVAYIGAYMGVQSSAIGQITKALENTPRLPVIWEHFQECTCCSESFIRSDHPIVADIILDKISLDYTLTLGQLPVIRPKRLKKPLWRNTKENIFFVLKVQSQWALTEIIVVLEEEVP